MICDSLIFFLYCENMILKRNISSTAFNIHLFLYCPVKCFFVWLVKLKPLNETHSKSCFQNHQKLP